MKESLIRNILINSFQFFIIPTKLSDQLSRNLERQTISKDRLGSNRAGTESAFSLEHNGPQRVSCASNTASDKKSENPLPLFPPAFSTIKILILAFLYRPSKPEYARSKYLCNIDLIGIVLKF